MHRAGGGDPTSAWQGRRGRALFQHVIEHCFRTTRHRQSPREDHDWRGRGVYVDRSRTWFADADWFAFGVAIDSGRARRDSESNARTGATTRARDITCWFIGSGFVACSFTCGESVIWA